MTISVERHEEKAETYFKEKLNMQNKHMYMYMHMYLPGESSFSPKILHIGIGKHIYACTYIYIQT